MTISNGTVSIFNLTNRFNVNPLQSEIGKVRINVTPCNYFYFVVHNGNRTEWSPIRSVIIRVINEIGRPRNGSPICLITSIITDRSG